MFLQYFWLVVLLVVILWYLVVTFLVALRGFGSLRKMLSEYSNNNE